jgi:hypothetical protein
VLTVVRQELVQRIGGCSMLSTMMGLLQAMKLQQGIDQQEFVTAGALGPACTTSCIQYVLG